MPAITAARGARGARTTPSPTASATCGRTLCGPRPTPTSSGARRNSPTTAIRTGRPRSRAIRAIIIIIMVATAGRRAIRGTTAATAGPRPLRHEIRRGIRGLPAILGRSRSRGRERRAIRGTIRPSTARAWARPPRLPRRRPAAAALLGRVRPRVIRVRSADGWEDRQPQRRSFRAPSREGGARVPSSSSSRGRRRNNRSSRWRRDNSPWS
mmetsp:Transcript_59309/g.126084  ORF Transcript_59309/g.126084 Transcript_59309/m.126084 type:complete len:211 (-) Transcript_59309:1735-2367(-)